MIIYQMFTKIRRLSFSKARKLKRRRPGGVLLPIFFLVSSLASALSLAQQPENLTLFEAFEQDANSPQSTSQGFPRSGDAATPEFRLMGMTRIGNKRSVLLLHRSGEALSIDLSVGQSVAIPRHAGYSVALMSSGQVAVQYPSSQVCRAALDQGVSCDSASNRALLSMAAAEPLPFANSFAGSAGATGATGVTSKETDNGQAEPEQPPLNPFEALRLRTESGQNANGLSPEEQAVRFRPRRIQPDQVPEGKRVVSTPFGDRLVDI